MAVSDSVTATRPQPQGQGLGKLVAICADNCIDRSRSIGQLSADSANRNQPPEGEAEPQWSVVTALQLAQLICIPGVEAGQIWYSHLF